MDALPAPALKAIGQYLDPQDAYSCRLASRCFTPVVPEQQPTSHIRVVANSFQAQLQQESAHTNSTAAPAAAAAPPAPPAVAVAVAETPLPLVHAAELNPSNALQQSVGATAADGDSTHRIYSTLRSRTAASLERAAAAGGAGYKRAVVYVDVQQPYADDTWQQIFGALLSQSSSINTLDIVEYSSSNDVGSQEEKAWDLDEMQAGQLTSLAGVVSDEAALAAAAAAAALRTIPPGLAAAARTEAKTARTIAAGTIDSRSWLIHLAAAYAAAGQNPALQHLNLQLPAPLPPNLQHLLLQLTGLKTLHVSRSKVWPTPKEWGLCHIEPWLSSDVIMGLTKLTQLESLRCVSSKAPTQEAGQVAVGLQQIFGDMGRQITHLSFGTADWRQSLQLSAPFINMPRLKTLICNRYFELDGDDVVETMNELSLQPGADGRCSSTCSSSSSGPAFLIAPSLTKLVVNHGRDDSRVLGLLAGQISAAAAAARMQLAHLELNGQQGVDKQLLSQLQGLRHLRIPVSLSSELEALANTPLSSSLQGLTILAHNARWVRTFHPIPLITSFIRLKSLAIYGRCTFALDPYQDLGALRVLTGLSHLDFSGELDLNSHTPPYDDALALQLSWGLRQDGCCTTGSVPPARRFVSELPSELHSLVIRIPDPSGFNEVNAGSMRFSLGAFPSSLTSVKFEGFYPCVEGSEGFGQPPGTAATAAAGVQGGSSSRRRVLGLQNLRDLAVQFPNMTDAEQLLRYCSGLEHLKLHLNPEHKTPSDDISEDIIKEQRQAQMRHWIEHLKMQVDPTYKKPSSSSSSQCVSSSSQCVSSSSKLVNSSSKLVNSSSQCVSSSSQCVSSSSQCVSSSSKLVNSSSSADTPRQLLLSDCCPGLRSLQILVAGDEHAIELASSHSTSPCDALLPPLWAGITGLTGLERLALVNRKGCVSFSVLRNILGSFSSLRCRTRLQDLSLQCNELTEAPPQNYQQQQQQQLQDVDPAARAKEDMEITVKDVQGWVAEACGYCSALKRLQLELVARHDIKWLPPATSLWGEPGRWGCVEDLKDLAKTWPMGRTRNLTERLDLRLPNCLVLTGYEVDEALGELDGFP